jgi:hypothetical protein
MGMRKKAECGQYETFENILGHPNFRGGSIINIVKVPILTNAILCTFFMIACLLSTVGLAGELPSKKSSMIPEEVNIYSRELKIISNDAKAGVGVEGLLRLGEKASDALVWPPSSGGADVLESLSEEDFQSVIRKMKGFSVNRQETVFVEPDPAFFIALAKRAGDQESVEFFEAYRKTEPNGSPVYIEQQTDYSGCIRYGTMSLVDTYTLWDTYSNKYPTRYSKEVMSFIRDIEDALTEWTCACDDKESVTRELKAFIQKFPSAKISKRLRERVDQIHQGKSKIREHCLSG